jgi:hypothetical protein
VRRYPAFEAFRDSSYEVTPLREAIAADLGRLAAKLEQGRVVPISGSGLSAGPPSSLPSGVTLGVEFRRWAEGKGLASQIALLPRPDDLGDLAQVVEHELGRDVLLSQLLSMIPWQRAPFNLGHLAIALMLAEGWITVGFTANWDLLVLAAAGSLEAISLPCPASVPTLHTASPPMHVHVHGRADAPDTLVATTGDLASPAALGWSDPQLRGALTMGEPLLVGFAVEPEYVVRTLETMLGVMGVPAAAVISLDTQADFVAKSPDLAAAVGLTATTGPYVSGSATDCLGEVVRHRYAEQIKSLLVKAEHRAQQAAGPLVATKPGVDRVVEVLLGGSLAHAQALLWHAAVLSSNDVTARQPILSDVGDHLADALAVLMLVCCLSDVTGLETSGEAMRISHSAGVLDVWLAMPSDGTQITEVVAAMTYGSSHFTRPGDDIVPLLLICARTFGRPPPGGPAGLKPRMSPGPSGRIAAPQRYPGDVLTLGEINDRIAALTGGSPPALTDIVRAW